MKKFIIYAIAFLAASGHTSLAGEPSARQSESSTTRLRDYVTTAITSTESTKAQHGSAATNEVPVSPKEESPSLRSPLTVKVESPAVSIHAHTPAPAPGRPADPTEAQPKLPTVALKIGKATVTAEVAADEKSRTMGLMFRKGLEKDHGMLFVMPRVAPVGFWMKNTSIPLSIAYISPEGRIMEIHDLVPHNEKAVRSQFPNIAYALEMRRGWFSDNAIYPGTAISGIPSSR